MPTTRLNCMSIAIDRVGLNKDVGEKRMTHFRAVAAGLQNAPCGRLIAAQSSPTHSLSRRLA